MYSVFIFYWRIHWLSHPPPQKEEEKDLIDMSKRWKPLWTYLDSPHPQLLKIGLLTSDTCKAAVLKLGIFPPLAFKSQILLLSPQRPFGGLNFKGAQYEESVGPFKIKVSCLPHWWWLQTFARAERGGCNGDFFCSPPWGDFTPLGAFSGI